MVVSTEELALTEEFGVIEDKVNTEELAVTVEVVSTEELALTEEFGVIEDKVNTEELAFVEDGSDAEELDTVVTAEELISAEDESDVEESRIELDESPVDVSVSVDDCKVLETLGTLIVILGLCPTHLLKIISVLYPSCNFQELTYQALQA